MSPGDSIAQLHQTEHDSVTFLKLVLVLDGHSSIEQVHLLVERLDKMLHLEVKNADLGDVWYCHESALLTSKTSHT